MAINAYYHMTQAGAGLRNGANWANAFDEPAFEAFVEGGGLIAGDVIFIMDGTYTLDSDIIFTVPGTAVSPIKLIGVLAGTTNVGANIVYADWATDPADFPLFNCGAFTFFVDDYNVAQNISFIGQHAQVFRGDNFNVIENCRMENDSGAGAGRAAGYFDDGNRVYNSEIIGNDDYGIRARAFCTLKYNYIHDSAIGIQNSNNGCNYEFNIITENTTGISAVDDLYINCDNNTFDQNGTDVDENAGSIWSCINNILSNNTVDGFNWNVETDINFFWHNHYFNNNSDETNVDTTTVFQDYERTAGNPLYDGADDYSLQNTSPCIGAGFSAELGT